MRKNLLPNNGVPLFIDDAEDLTAKKDVLFDSWYVKAEVETDGGHIGIQWHHQTQNVAPGQDIVVAEFAIMNGTTHEYLPFGAGGPVSEENGASAEELKVVSSLGIFTGNKNKMELHLASDTASLDVEMVSCGELLTNGTTGLLHFIGSDSYEYSYPNMDMNGTLKIREKTYEIKNAKAWFDRQWATMRIDTESILEIPGKKHLSWLWLGMPLTEDGSENISLWDAYGAKGRNAFATIQWKDGTQDNVLCDIAYDGIWKSEKSGSHYPKTVSISIPKAKINLKLESVIDNPESASDLTSGCQDLCHVTGNYGSQKIDRYNVLEIVGDLCGEDR